MCSVGNWDIQKEIIFLNVKWEFYDQAYRCPILSERNTFSIWNLLISGVEGRLLKYDLAKI